MIIIMAFSGTSSFMLTFFHHLDPGIAPSRAKAQVHRDEAVVHPMPQKSARTSRGRSRAMLPPVEPMADLMMTGTGCAETRAASSAWSGITKTSGIRKMRPAMVLRTMVATMALGTCVAGCCTSSHMEMIIPVDEVA